MNEVYNFLRRAGTYYLATIEDNQPRVRPFGTSCIFEDKFYILTSKLKNVSKQIEKNPRVEICACIGNEWLRIATTLVNDDRIEAKQAVIDALPGLEATYKATDPNTQVLYFKDTVATFSSYTTPPREIRF